MDSHSLLKVFCLTPGHKDRLLHAYGEDGANAEPGNFSFVCGENSYNFLEGHRGELFNSETNGNYL